MSWEDPMVALVELEKECDALRADNAALEAEVLRLEARLCDRCGKSALLESFGELWVCSQCQHAIGEEYFRPKLAALTTRAEQAEAEVSRLQGVAARWAKEVAELRRPQTVPQKEGE